MFSLRKKIVFSKLSSRLQGPVAVHWNSTIESGEEYHPCEVAAPE